MSATTLKATGITAARDFQDLPAWQKAMTLAEQVFAKTEAFPLREHVGLASAMRDSVQNVASHIAGASAKSNEHAIGESYGNSQQALSILFTQATLAARLGYLSTDDALTMLTDLEEVERLLIGLRHGLKTQAKEEARVEREEAQRSREIEAKSARDERGGDRPYRRAEGSYERPQGERPSRDSADRPRREAGSYDRPRRDTGDRPQSDRPRRESSSYDRPRRDAADRPRRDAGDRPERSRSEYRPRDPETGERPAGGRDSKPYGAKKSFGDKKPYGDRKPYAGGGDKKPFRKGPPRSRD
jgi:four helix bundle protein